MLRTCLFAVFVCAASWVLAQSYVVNYDFDRPELIVRLPEALEEISGLSLSPNPDELLAVEDENGKFYRLSLSSGRVLGATKFWKDGDYEGIEAVGNDIWVVKSTGTLYRIRRPGLADQEVTKFNGFLNEENNVEGLTYDRANQRLLLVCKDEVGMTEVRNVFAFDLNREELIENPVYSIGRMSISTFLTTCLNKTRKHNKLLAFINEREKYELSPSAIAIHPLTGQVFITSSVGKVLVILNREGMIEHVQKLEKDYFAQPEGLVFTPDGTLYISTEAKDGEPARIFRLRPLS